MSQDISKRYAQRGVSAGKEDVHNAIKNVDKGLFPQAFCKIVPDYLTGDDDYCLIMHADGDGTKSSLAYMYWKETGDLSVWKGVAQDALIMNVDDLLCVGAVDKIMLSSTIGRNKNLIPGEVISAIINGTEELIKDLPVPLPTDLPWAVSNPQGNIWIRLVGYILTKILRLTTTSVEVDLESFSELMVHIADERRIAPDGEGERHHIILAPTHRSL